MTVGRIVGVILILLLAAVAVVGIRTNQVAIAGSAGRLHMEKIALERDIWEQEMTLARLRGTEQVLRRTGEPDDVNP